MKLFRRNQSTTTMPPEVAEYYQTEQRRERRGVAWLMTLLALLVTVAIVLGLFLAGRWLYRAISNDGKPTATTTQNQPGGDNKPSDSPAATDGAPEQNPTVDEPRQDSSADDATNTTDRESRPSPPAQGDPSAQSSQTDELTDTGPGETAIVLFVATSIIAFVSRTRRVQRQNAR